MGLFDRFKKRVKEVAEEVDSDALTAVEDSEEAVAALESLTPIEEEWEEDVPEVEHEPNEETVIESQDDDWDDWEGLGEESLLIVENKDIDGRFRWTGDETRYMDDDEGWVLIG